MPIEVNRKDISCPECKNPTIFDTGKKYFCGKCLNDFDKNSMQKLEKPKGNAVENPLDLTVDDLFVPAVGFHCEKSANPDVITDPQIMVDSNVSTPVM